MPSAAVDLRPGTRVKCSDKETTLGYCGPARVLRDAGIPVTTDSLQAWEIGRWNPRAPVALALAEFLQRQPKRRPR